MTGERSLAYKGYRGLWVALGPPMIIKSFPACETQFSGHKIKSKFGKEDNTIGRPKPNVINGFWVIYLY